MPASNAASRRATRHREEVDDDVERHGWRVDRFEREHVLRLRLRALSQVRHAAAWLRDTRWRTRRCGACRGARVFRRSRCCRRPPARQRTVSCRGVCCPEVGARCARLRWRVRAGPIPPAPARRGLARPRGNCRADGTARVRGLRRARTGLSTHAVNRRGRRRRCRRRSCRCAAGASGARRNRCWRA